MKPVVTEGATKSKESNHGGTAGRMPWGRAAQQCSARSHLLYAAARVLAWLP